MKFGGNENFHFFFVTTALAQKSIHESFVAKEALLIPLFSLRPEGIFRGSFTPRAQNTILEQASSEGTVGEGVFFVYCGTNPVPNFRTLVNIREVLVNM